MSRSEKDKGGSDFAPVERSMLEFPADFPLKIMGRRTDDFAQQVLEIVLRHAPDFDTSRTEMRVSSQGRYLGITVTIRAVSQQQLDALYRDLSSHPMVSIVL